MPYYLIQTAYTPGSWEKMIENPQDRVELVRPAIEGMGGRIEAGYISFGEYDFVGGTRELGQGYFSTGSCTQDKYTARYAVLAITQGMAYEGGALFQVLGAVLAQPLTSLRPLRLDIAVRQAIDAHNTYLPVYFAGRFCKNAATPS